MESRTRLSAGHLPDSARSVQGSHGLLQNPLLRIFVWIASLLCLGPHSQKRSWPLIEKVSQWAVFSSIHPMFSDRPPVLHTTIQKISPRYNNRESETSEPKDSGAFLCLEVSIFVISYCRYHYHHRILRRNSAERKKHNGFLARNHQRSWNSSD